MMPGKADNFVLKDQDGNDFELYKNLDKNLLLVFYPKDDSPVCSRQLKDYSDSMQSFDSSGIKVVGINDALPEEHKLFCGKKGLDMVLLSDPGRKVIERFGALFPFGIVKRKLVLLNRDADIIFEKNFFPAAYWDSGRILQYLAENEFF